MVPCFFGVFLCNCFFCIHNLEILAIQDINYGNISQTFMILAINVFYL